MSIEAINILLDRAPNETTVKKIYRIAGEINGVLEVHGLRVRVVGDYIIGDLHVLVDPDLTVAEGHNICEMVSEKLEKELKARITIHLEPYDEANRLNNSNR